jgi:ankyrin repeat protein
LEVELTCNALLQHLRQGDFSLLAPAFESHADRTPRVLQLYRDGCFNANPDELAEALTCAAFLGAIPVLDALLAAGVPPHGGNETGMDALHWAANRGQLVSVRRLLNAGAVPERRNRFGGTVLGATVWAAVHEPRPTHAAIVEVLLAAGADVSQAEYPSGIANVDAILKAAGAGAV